MQEGRRYELSDSHKKLNERLKKAVQEQRPMLHEAFTAQAQRLKDSSNRRREARPQTET